MLKMFCEFLVFIRFNTEFSSLLNTLPINTVRCKKLASLLGVEKCRNTLSQAKKGLLFCCFSYLFPLLKSPHLRITKQMKKRIRIVVFNQSIHFKQSASRVSVRTICKIYSRTTAPPFLHTAKCPN